MSVVETEKLSPSALQALGPEGVHQTYCGLDCCVTLEVFEALRAQRTQPPRIYDFERALQAPYLDMMQRGFAVDELSRQTASAQLTEEINHLQEVLDEFARASWDRPLNPRSYKQLQEFFYSALALPPVYSFKKGVKRVSTDRDALEKLEEKYLYARPIVNCILSIRDLAKQREVFDTEIDPDRRHRSSYNIAGTETGRPSSSENAFGTGGNAQNIRPSLRYVFVADAGKKICVIDLEQVEARDVGFFQGCLFGDWTFLDACESGDLHTNNARLVWPELKWGEDAQANRRIAEQIFYRDFSYRDMAKRGGHLSNYYGGAATMARALKIPLAIAQEFHLRYNHGPNCAYPGFQRWWNWTATQIQTSHRIVTPFGRERLFFGRPGDDTTLREAIAFLPQSTTADRMNLGLWRIWRYMPEVELLAQTYDSVTFQYDESADEQEIIGRALELIRVELRAPNGRSYVVPGEAKVGWNWGAQVTQADVAKALAKGLPAPRLNPDGLVKFKLGKRDERKRSIGLQRVPI